MSKPLKIALVCDWLTNVGGAEKVLKALHEIYPSAPIYTSQYNPKGIDWFKSADVRTGWLQIFPSSLRRFLGPLRQLYFQHLDLSAYDLIISVTGAEAKSIKKGTAIHLCYCHVPTQYYWQLYSDYLKNPGFGFLNPVVRFFFKLFVGPLRKADYRAAQQPDQFITISTYAATQIQKYYNRESTIIFPPVAVENFSASTEHCQKNNTQKDHFVNYSRQANWKRLDLLVKACLKNQQKLVLIGSGPEHQKLVKLANNSPLITFLPTMTQPELICQLKSAQAFLFPSLEPFGIAPVEALASGCPVIAYGQGGATDYIVDGKNGLTFKHQTVASLCKTLNKFSSLNFSTATIKSTAKKFSESEFKHKIKELVDAQISS